MAFYLQIHGYTCKRIFFKMMSSIILNALLLQIHGTGALVISAMLDFLTFALCAPYSETTDGGHFDSLLETVAANGRIIFKLFQVRQTFTDGYIFERKTHQNFEPFPSKTTLYHM